METKSFEKGKGKEHLDKKFLEELKHKIWSTKGTRFTADERLKKQSKLSMLSISFLSAYLIIFGLVSFYNLLGKIQIDLNLLAFSITALSILLLVFSLVENSQNYIIKAKSFHDCALDLSDLYNELQNYKSYKDFSIDEEKMKFCETLQAKYQIVLRKYENHDPIDNAMFRLNHPDYYTIKWQEYIITPFNYFIKTKLIYLSIMILPTLLLCNLIK
jgi:hypothetical protein